MNAIQDPRYDHAAEAAFANEMGLALDTGNLVPGQIVLANASRFTEANFNQPLTSYAVGGWDKQDIEEELNFFAPPVQTSRYFTYANAVNAEDFLSETVDDMRAEGADFKRVEYTSTKTTAKTLNRGLTLRVDLDEVAEKSGWEEAATMKLMRRLKRNSLRRAVTLIAAAGTNTARTWDTTALKDPDQDVITSHIAAAALSGIIPNRVGYGETAWSKRMLAHRAQNTAGGFASAALTPEALAGFLGVDRVLRSKARYSSSSTARTEVVANLVLSFMAMDGMDTEDPSNIKRFYSPTVDGGPVRVYVQQVSAKLVDVTVEHYELIKITSTLGIRKETIS